LAVGAVDQRDIRLQFGHAVTPAAVRCGCLPFAGWGGVFSAANRWWWVPIISPLIGGIVGGYAYDAFVGGGFRSLKSEV
jgi:glycerol uptake facilitator-like aquaporin